MEVGLGYLPLGQTRQHAFGRRGAADQAGQGARQARQRPHALPARRADDRIARRGYRAAGLAAPPPGRRREHGRRHRAQPGSRPLRGLGDRPRAGGRRRGRLPRRGGDAGSDRRGGEFGDGEVPK